MVQTWKTWKGYLAAIPMGVWVVSGAVYLAATSTCMMFSISPYFMTETLGLSTFSMGAIEGVSEALSQFSKLFSGVFTDLIRRRKSMLTTGFSVAAFSKLFFILAAGPFAISLVMASKVFERLSNGLISTPRDAYVAEVSNPKNRGFCLGLMMSFKTLGCTVGSLLISWLLYYFTDYQVLLWIGFVHGVAAVFLLAFFLKEKAWKVKKSGIPTETENQEELASPDSGRGVKKANKPKSGAGFLWRDLLNLPRAYWILILVSSIFMLARFPDSFLILRMRELGGSKQLGASLIGIFNLVSTFCCLFLGYFSDRMRRFFTLYFPFVTLVLSELFFLGADWMGEGVGLGMLGVILWGAQRGTSQIMFTSLIADLVPHEILGTAIGFFYIMTGVVAIGGGFIAGKISLSSLSSVFLFGTLVSFAALIGLMVWHWTLRVKKDRFLYPVTG